MLARGLAISIVTAIATGTVLLSAAADGPKDNVAEKVRPVPPRGIELSPADAQEIARGLAELQGLIQKIGKHELLPDVQIYEKAVRWALEYREVFDAKGIPTLKKVLKTGLERARAMVDGQTPWTSQTGLVVRGYRSRVDGSVQPYGLVVPQDYDFTGKRPHRLDFWWHGRGETLSEANFIQERQTSPGAFTPPSTLVLHPYGRYCNANKFAGEIDTLECLVHARKHYRIDEDRIVARGFSMGGAACWQFATHYPSLWCAAAPGAGFSETPEFLKVFQNETVQPSWYEKKLWHLYNASDYALNIFNIPTVAYSGEIDSQKQAADVMAREMKKVGLELTHIIGPKTAHAYEKNAKEEVSRRIDAFAEKGRDTFPKEIRSVTYTTRYNRCGWVEIVGMEKHWEPAEVIATHDGGGYNLKTKGVASLRIFPKPSGGEKVKVDGTAVEAAEPMLFSKNPNGQWEINRKAPRLSKHHGLQGPIDDGFMDTFVFVRPTGQPINEKVGSWVSAEMKHAMESWRSQFRGDAPIKNDSEITDDDLRNANLVLWGDPKSNALLAKVAGNLPVKWTEKGIQVGEQLYEPGTHVPVLIYPNPLNPERYIVINSGFTFREYDYLNNARQVPKLPDYAVIDMTTPPNARYPGKIVRAGFFGEQWELLPRDGE